MRCCVPFCESSSEDSSPASTTEQIGFFAFPSSNTEVASWRRALGVRGSLRGAAVCSRHFLREDMSGEGCLRAGAVPTTAQVCMICLDSGSKMFSMSHYNLKEAYEHLTGQPLFDAGNLKHTLCVECVQRLTNFVKFRDKSLRSRAVMMDLVQRHKVVTIQHIAALQPLKSNLNPIVLEADHFDQHVLEDSADAVVDIGEVKMEPELHMTLDSADAPEDGSADAQADDTIKVKLEPDAHVTWYSSDDSIQQDAKLLDAAMCRVLLTRMPCVEQRALVMRDPLKVESVTVQGAECGEEFTYQHDERPSDRTTLGMEGCSAAAPRLPVRLGTDNETDTSPTSEQAFEIGDDQEVNKSSHENIDGREIFSVYVNEDRDTDSEGSDYYQTTSQDELPTSETTEPVTTHTTVETDCSNVDVKVENIKMINDDNVRTHTGNQIEGKILICDFCKTVFKRKSLLVSHIRRHHCTYKTKLVSLVKFHAGDKPFACKFCDYRTSNKCNLVDHVRTHTGEKPYACEVCKRKFAVKRNLVRHMKTHPDVNALPFACKLCEYKCLDMDGLVRHMRIHADDKPFACKLCKYRSCRNLSLVNHLRTHTGEKPYTCEVCKYKFAARTSLVRHMRIHTGEKPYACTLCYFKCTQNSSLARHMKNHTGNKTFVCKVCKFKCVERNYLVRHMRSHTGEKPFACNQCQYKCTESGNLVKHMRIHTGEKPFACHECQNKFTHKSSLVQHMRTHTGEKPFACHECQNKFTHKSSLGKHMRIHTGD